MYTVLTKEQVEQNFVSLRNLAVQVCPINGSMLKLLNELELDRIGIIRVGSENKVLYLGLKNAPAAKANHHAYVGGLTLHMLEMWTFWLDLRERFIGEGIPRDPLITDSNVFLGILVHDLHKAWNTFVSDTSIPSGVNYGTHPTSLLMTNDQKSAYILQFFFNIDAVMANCMYSSEGGYAKDAPKTQTTLAKLVYILDELSSNVLARTQQGNSMDNRTVGITVDPFEYTPLSNPTEYAPLAK